jgi:phage-related minor tail protein
LSTIDILAVIGALTVSVTSIVSTVFAGFIAARTSAIKRTTEDVQRTGEATAHQLNSRTDAMMELLETQRKLLQHHGIQIPPDGSLPMNKEG